MTIEGAIAELQNLIKADDVPLYYNGAIQKVIETIIDECKSKVGKWIRAEEGELICSICEYPAEFNPLSSDFIETNYCPNCGAKMEG